MRSLTRHIKLAPVLLLALLAVGTSVQVGCGGSVDNGAKSDDALRENPPVPDGTGGDPNTCGGYGYGYGCGGYGYGGYGGYGYGGYGYDR
ncbi:MAG TPA: hypothetical protein VLT33_33535 [Labilithrix sp.]|nr:hypothetical protein [Labilithrix sp.]